jgi:hypothetical protein
MFEREYCAARVLARREAAASWHEDVRGVAFGESGTACLSGSAAKYRENKRAKVSIGRGRLGDRNPPGMRNILPNLGTSIPAHNDF